MGWVTRISAKLSELGIQHHRDVMVINVSYSGNTTRQALERMPYDIQSQNPDALIVQFGMNDCNYWETDRGNPRVSSKAFAANLEEIIVRAFTFGCQRIFLHTNHPSARDQIAMHHTTITYQESNRRYNEIIREVARGFDGRIILNDIEAVFDAFTDGDRKKLLSLLLPEPDLLHLSKFGHDLYFNTVYPVIEREIKDLVLC